MADYSTSSKPKKTLDLLSLMFDEALRCKKKQVEDRWAKADKYWKGENSRFKGQADSEEEWRADTKTNLLYSFYLSMVAVLMRELPGFEAVGRYAIHNETGRHVSRLGLSVMRRNEFPERQEEMLFSGSLYGRALLKTTWDGRIDRGVGGIRLDTVGAKSFCWQPGKLRHRDAAYIFEYHDLSKLDLLSMYPHRRADLDKAFTKEGYSETMNLDIKEPSSQGSYDTGLGLTNYYSAYEGGSDSMSTVTVVECWMDDPETIERVGWVVEAKGSKLSAVKRKRHFAVYPTGRYIRFIPGCLILEDRPNAFPGKPYSEYVNMSDGQEWPAGELDQLIPIQDIHDTRNNQTMDALNYSITGDKLVIDSRSGIKDKNEITNTPGEILEVASVEGIKNIPGPRVPGEAFASLESIKSDFDRVSGAPDILSQLQDIDIRSGYGVDAISEIVRGRLKLKTYSMEACYRETFRQITEMIGFFYVRGTHYPFDLDLTGVHPEMFEFNVKAGMNLPSSRRSQEQMNLQFFDRGAVDEQYLVEESDLPNKDALLERMRPRWEALQKQMMAGPPAAQRPTPMRSAA